MGSRSSRKGILVVLVLMGLVMMTQGAFAPHELKRVEEDIRKSGRTWQDQIDLITPNPVDVT
jgi:hypothetical protein